MCWSRGGFAESEYNSLANFGPGIFISHTLHFNLYTATSLFNFCSLHKFNQRIRKVEDKEQIFCGNCHKERNVNRIFGSQSDVLVSKESFSSNHIREKRNLLKFAQKLLFRDKFRNSLQNKSIWYSSTVANHWIWVSGVHQISIFHILTDLIWSDKLKGNGIIDHAKSHSFTMN